MLAIVADAKNIHTVMSSKPFVTHPDISIDSFWVNYDQSQEGKKGILVHMKLSVYGLKDIDCAVAIYFLYGFEKPVKDKNQKFYTTAGNVAVFKDIKPIYDDAVFNGLQIFMPYDELELDPGSHKLKMDIDFTYSDGTRIQHLKYYDFNFTQAGSGGPGVTKNTADIAKSGLTKKDVLSKVINIVAEGLDIKPETIKLQNNFMKDLDADYMEVGLIFMDINEKFGVKIPNKEQAEITTVQHLYEYLVKKLKISK
jgi:acyl carrier protein